MTWEDVLKRDDIVGGDIETYENEDIYRGPISEILLKDGYITINAEWIAVMECSEFGKWKKGNIAQLIFPAETPPANL